MKIQELRLPAEAPLRAAPGDEELDIAGFRRASIAIVVKNAPGGGEELLVIKRAERASDRWSGHIGLPGGRREPGESDFDAAVRETAEEVGVDLAKRARFVGALAPRVIRVLRGTKPVLILCPFVFCMHDGPDSEVPLVPQPSEVAAVFWYPTARLFDERSRGTETVPARRADDPSVLIEGEFTSFDAIVIDQVSVTAPGPVPPLPWKMWGITLGVVEELRSLLKNTL